MTNPKQHCDLVVIGASTGGVLALTARPDGTALPGERARAKPLYDR